MGMEWIDEIGALNGESSCGVLFFDWCVERIKKKHEKKQAFDIAKDLCVWIN